jgi:hypothetical protein
MLSWARAEDYNRKGRRNSTQLVYYCLNNVPGNCFDRFEVIGGANSAENVLKVSLPAAENGTEPDFIPLWRT